MSAEVLDGRDVVLINVTAAFSSRRSRGRRPLSGSFLVCALLRDL